MQIPDAHSLGATAVSWSPAAPAGSLVSAKGPGQPEKRLASSGADNSIKVTSFRADQPSLLIYLSWEVLLEKHLQPCIPSAICEHFTASVPSRYGATMKEQMSGSKMEGRCWAIVIGCAMSRGLPILACPATPLRLLVRMARCSSGLRAETSQESGRPPSCMTSRLVSSSLSAVRCNMLPA